MQWLTVSRFVALGFAGATCIAGCAQSPAPSTSEGAVDAAYAALVADVATCAKEVKSCVDAAGSDEAATDTCRDQFASCRLDAGKRSGDALENATRSCTTKHKECVHEAASGEAGSCQDELRGCLGAAHSDKHDDGDDAGADNDNDKRKAARSDCLDELHVCVKADGPANVCAEQVRMCVVDSVPSPLAVVPKRDEDRAGSGKPDDAGAGRGKPARADAADGGVGRKHDGADAGERGNGAMTAARECVDTFRACIDGGNPARGCASSLKECRNAAKP